MYDVELKHPRDQILGVTLKFTNLIFTHYTNLTIHDFSTKVCTRFNAKLHYLLNDTRGDE